MLKCRSLVSQLCAIFPYIYLQFVLGSIVGFQIVLIGELHKSDSEIPTTIEQLSWYVSLDILLSLGTILTGVLMQRLGSRLMTLMVALLYFASFLLYHHSTSATTAIASRMLSSLLSVHPVSAPYICEVSEPRFRGSFQAIALLANNIGAFFSMLLGGFLYWRTLALVNLIFPILATVTVLVTPNSPTWLASKGRLDEAEKALCWLRGWVQPQKVQIEFRALVDNAQPTKRPSYEEKIDVETRAPRRPLRLFLRRSFWTPLGTMCLVILMYILSGMDAIEAYATVIFREMDSLLDESMATAAVGTVGVLGTLVILLVVRRVGRRKMVLVSVTVAGSCQAIVAACGFLELRGQYNAWIAPIALVVAFFANYSGIGGIVYMTVGEIFPPYVRYVGASISVSAKNVFKSLINKSFLYAVEAITLPGVFLLFAFVNVVALITYYYVFPETEGKSLEEIEDHFKGVKSSNETG